MLIHYVALCVGNTTIPGARLLSGFRVINTDKLFVHTHLASKNKIFTNLALVTSK